MRFKYLLVIGLTALTGFTATSVNQYLSENYPPAIKIISPVNNSEFQWNSIIPYSILVSDKEDGNSEYNEISPNEVLLFVTYFPDSAGLKKNILNQSLVNRGPLLLMSTSTCFNCHASKSKRIGPSFESIAGRYSGSTVSVDDLAKKIIGGSSGTWGDEKMPPHPELQIGQAKELVRWILENSSNPNQTFYAGVEGSIRTREKSGEVSGNAIYVLTASYTDHGVNGITGSSKKGLHTIVLKNHR